MKVSLIISTYNQALSFGKVLRGLSLQTRLPDEILIADDGSTDGTADLIAEWKSKSAVPVRHCWHPNKGFLKLKILNKTVASATGDYLIFLDGDCVPHREFIADHAALAEPGFWVQGRRCFILEPFVAEFQPGETSLLKWTLKGRVARPFKSLRLPFAMVSRDTGQRGIIGCNMAFWRDDVVAVNGFDETYLGRGMGADSDLGSRVYNLGRKRKFVYGRALVYHLDHPIAPRPNFAHNRALLDDVLRSGRTRCELGLNQYLGANHTMETKPPADGAPN
jgi:glycosyltransferase involved in cell wall biosynthesis